MKKTISLVALTLIIAVCFTSFAACNNGDGEQSDITVNIIVPDGAPALSFAMLMAGAATLPDGYDETYSVGTGEQVVAKVLNKEADVAVIPLNAAATLYNRGVEYTLVSTNIDGILYIIGSGTATSLAGLVGEVVYSIGQGNTPEYVFKYLLSNAGIEYEDGDTAVAGKVVIKYVADASSALPLILAGTVKYGLVGEPAATTAVTRGAASGVANLFDLQALWRTATSSEASYPQAGMLVKNSLIETHPEYVTALLSALIANENWVVENASTVGATLSNHGSLLTTQYTADMITRCNIVTRVAGSNKTAIEAYFNVLYNFNPNSIGGKLPDDGMYYTNEQD